MSKEEISDLIINRNRSSNNIKYFDENYNKIKTSLEFIEKYNPEEIEDLLVGLKDNSVPIQIILHENTYGIFASTNYEKTKSLYELTFTTFKKRLKNLSISHFNIGYDEDKKTFKTKIELTPAVDTASGF
jgi:hypothetical protein